MHLAQPLKLVTTRIGHHAGRSGYHRLAEFLPGEVVSASTEGLFAKLAAPIARRTGSSWYAPERQLDELKLLGQLAWSKPQIVHYLYGENCFHTAARLPHWFTRRHCLIATYHVPGWRFEEIMPAPEIAARLDAIAVMSTVQIPYFEKFVGQGNVHFVPHGIDVDYFRPAPHPAGEKTRLITVGHHLRDFDALAKVADAFADQKDLEFIVVARPDTMNCLRGKPNVTCLSGLSDEALLNRYQEADALFLPLIDATANNALLEGMACGLPVISTDLVGVHDYVCSEHSLLAQPGDVDELCELVQKTYTRRVDLQQLGQASRARAEQLAWPCVAETMLRLYTETVERKKAR